jgi:hypothetical protein
MKKFKSLGTIVLPLIAGLLLTVSLASCEQITGFFSSSWGKGLARDPDKLFPTVSGKNAQDLADETAGDPEAAKALLKKIKEAAKNATGAEKEALQKAGLTAANNSSDVMGVVLGNATKIKNLIDDPDGALDEVTSLINQAGDVKQTADDIEELFTGADAATYESMPSDQLTIAALTLLIDEADGGTIDKNTINELNPANGGDKTTIAYEMLKAAKKDKNSVFGDMLKNLPEV